MKATSKNLFARGKSSVFYCRRRIPSSLKYAYPPTKTEIVECLHTSDRGVANQRLGFAMLRIEVEFEQKKVELAKKKAAYTRTRLEKLTDDQLGALADFWVRQVLLNDEQTRHRGLDDDEFDEIGSQLEQQRAELGRMMATGRTDKILPAMNGFIHLCGIDVDMSPAESKRAGAAFLTAVVTALDHQLARQAGQVVLTAQVAPERPSPKELVAQSLAAPKQSQEILGSAFASDAHGPSWEEVFKSWREYVPSRPKSTAIATQTPWLELQSCAAKHGAMWPADVTPDIMRKFVEGMHARGLAIVTLNERLAKIKSLFRVTKGLGKLAENPAADTIGRKQTSFEKREKRRLPFSDADLKTIFSSPIFNGEHLRSQGQSGEASYWLPLLMFYTGARPEEIAGLALADIVKDPVHGWYVNIIDRPSTEDDLFTKEKGSGKLAQQEQWRTLKNGSSIRKVPLAAQLIELGLLRYVDSLKKAGAVSLFPMLTHDWHNKLSGAFSKFFGRYKVKVLGITDPKKVLYSFRHSMKDAMTAAQLETKYLHRILGHASGEGVITDGYGSVDLPLNLLVEQFKKISFPSIAAKSWEAGKGRVRFAG